MCSKKLLLVASFLTVSSLSRAVSISIPNNSFEGLSGSVSGPSLGNLGIVGIAGTNTTTFGAWSVSIGATVGGLLTSLSVGLTNALGEPGGADGTTVTRISLPLGLGSFCDMHQTLSTTCLPNTIYTLTCEIDPGTILSLISGTTLSLDVGSTPVASLSDNNLVAALVPNNQFETVSLTFQTGNTAPTGNLGIDWDTSSVAGLGGNLALDDFQLNANPVPEPSVLALSSLGLLALFGASQRPILKPAKKV